MRVWAGKAHLTHLGKWRRSFHVGFLRVLLADEYHCAHDNAWVPSGHSYKGARIELWPWRWMFGYKHFRYDGDHKAVGLGPLIFFWGS